MQKLKQDKTCNIGKAIRTLRVKSGMTQDEVTAKLQLRGCDISRSIYSQIECGTYSIRVCELIILRQIFKVDYSAFFDALERDLTK